MPLTLRPSRKVRKSRKRATTMLSISSETLSAYSIRQHGYITEIELALEQRNSSKAYDDEGKEVTPKMMKTDHFHQFKFLRHKLIKHLLLGPFESETKVSKVYSQIRMGGLRLSMDEIIRSINTQCEKDDDLSIHDTNSQLTVITSAESSVYDLESLQAPPETYNKVNLMMTKEMLLYAQQCTTALRGTKEGDRVDHDNRAYEYLTEGKGKLRRRSDTEVQTIAVIMKTRFMNTDQLNTHAKATYVSNFDMYDTLKEVEEETKMQQLLAEEVVDDGAQPLPVYIHIQKHKRLYDQTAAIAALPEFHLAIMLIKRFLAGNNYGAKQRRFRGMDVPNPLDKVHKISYKVRELFRFAPQSYSAERKAVTDISWSEKHSDILAVGYGLYSFSTMHVPSIGVMCVWNIKNPDDPERIYNFNASVVSLAFSPFLGSLLAVGLYDGSVQVFDITEPNDPPIATTNPSTAPSCEPVMKIRWIGNTADESAQIDPFLALYHNSAVIKYRIINSPFLLGFQQIMLERNECQIDGIPVKNTKVETTLANRRPQGLNLTLHPTQKDVYYVLTDEGAMHKCSTNYPHQHLEAEQTHEAAVNGLSFAPWSPDIFLTYGNDWVVRVWLDGVFRPLITLKNRSGAVHSAYWSRTHSTVIFALNRKTLDIWDIRRTIMKPVSSIQIDSSYNTTCRLSRNGTSIAIGNERGNILICGLEEFPFPPHFQYDELENAIIKAVSSDKDLLQEVLMKGIHSYPNKKASFH